MSELRVDSVKSKGGGAPDLPKGVTISGITTAVTLGATQIDVSNVNVSGVVTSGTLNGPLLSTGTPTLGLGVTINSSGLHISGVATAGIVSATTLYGDGTNLTGIAASLAPLFYNPDVSDSLVTFDTGIGITFNQQIKAGTGNITIRETNASGTVVENFGVGSSVTISENRVTFSPTSDLSEDAVYHVSYPSGCFTNNEGSDYVGTAYTFKALAYTRNLWMWGSNETYGMLGQNSVNDDRSSPVQVPGTKWKSVVAAGVHVLGVKGDNTLWSWGENEHGCLGHNNLTNYSSPVQIPGTTWSTANRHLAGNSDTAGSSVSGVIKTDGTLWVWGDNNQGQLGINNTTDYSSPKQIPGTTWNKIVMSSRHGAAIKTDGTMWAWGNSQRGELAQNNRTSYSSPVQIPGTTWSDLWISGSGNSNMATIKALKTDGTLWSWGYDHRGQCGQNSISPGYSSPVQIPGTTWSKLPITGNSWSNAIQAAIRTDGSLWSWGINDQGSLGINSPTYRSSPTQIPGSWSEVTCFTYNGAAVKTDGTLWAWGHGAYGQLAQNNETTYSSPKQVGSETDWTRISGGKFFLSGIRRT